MDEFVPLVDRVAAGAVPSRDEMVRMAQLAHERLENARWLLAAMYDLQARAPSVERAHAITAIIQAGELALVRHLNVFSGD